MSWTPTFFLKRKDFDNFKSSIASIDGDDVRVWEFSIGEVKGVVVSAGDTTYGSRNLHDVFRDLPHWILDGEGEACENCHGWGDSIELSNEE